MTDFISFLDKLSALSPAVVADLQLIIKQKHYDQGGILLENGQVCKRLYFIDSGLVKMGFYKEAKEFIMRFFSEGSLLTGLDSYLMQQPSAFTITALEPTLVSYISKIEFEALCQKHHSLESAVRNFYAMVSLNMMKRISEILEEDATERYRHFLCEQGGLLQRIKLGDLAAYLGITQVSLSRIRSKI